MKKYHLSVVATSRNDNHGGSLTYRMQHFVDGFVEQCKRHGLSAELILVEWNPPQDKPSLAEALRFPFDKGPCDIRIIRVPPEIHAQFKHGDNLPLYQMIGKNVGIQRALGEFVLATNIDILFSDAVILFMRDRLKKGVLYRSDRLDVPNELPAAESFDELLHFCQKNYFRINGKYGTKNLNDPQLFSRTMWKVFFTTKMKAFLSSKRVMMKRIGRSASSLRAWKRLARRIVSIGTYKARILSIKETFKLRLHLLYPFIKWPLRAISRVIGWSTNHRLHTNGCGDFTLLSRDDWEKLRGYPEWDTFSFHIDSVLLFQANQHGIKEIDLPRKMSVYHIEHGPGSGYSAEAAHLLFQRLDEKGVPYLTYPELMQSVKQMRQSPIPVVYNHESWGMARLNLEEVRV